MGNAVRDEAERGWCCAVLGKFGNCLISIKKYDIIFMCHTIGTSNSGGKIV